MEPAWKNINWQTRSDPAKTLPGWDATLGHWLNLEIAQSSDGTFFCRAGGRHVAGGLSSLEKAKDAVTTEARDMLARAAKELEALTSPPEPEPEGEVEQPEPFQGRRGRPRKNPAPEMAGANQTTEGNR